MSHNGKVQPFNVVSRQASKCGCVCLNSINGAMSHMKQLLCSMVYTSRRKSITEWQTQTQTQMQWVDYYNFVCAFG